ncbi:ribosomal protein L7/L12 [Clostridium perfringens]|uniref:ribosomal protein L7/L12 n=1 Tax=Clostridium perfringens TaxID=1502 RepID=UPI001A294CD0|nr:ribosomal protein L7/L12 [Clostridium perfringens]ELC8353654.1 ribosomal protein L7/L12 [Clostridium perfringens]ELC8462495.1 ribosomal protein L7/L12 [Clostridium perfringens]MBO3395066.1 ribosomal protein L7/L12 [Clostridium perfringens]MBO3400880.1 ribosomal protein L7/L12 [Clostridium perfringens]MCX0363588.1 ribosomal protein L7/L12 [Clostridium perfringens]
MNIDMGWMILGFGAFIFLISSVGQLRNEVKLMRRTLNRIAERVGVTEILTKEEKEELKRLLSEGKNVQAVRRCREITGLGLKEAKEYVDRLGVEHIE